MNTPDYFEKILNEAHAAATAAIRAMFDAGKSEQPFNCGFAWVTIDGTSPMARHCRKMANSETGQSKAFKSEYHHRYGDKGYPRGWQWWGPGDWPSSQEMGHPVYTQDMDFKAAGARAFQDVLGTYGYNATVGTRLD